jgi:hydroxyacylglutathione hydrolase
VALYETFATRLSKLPDHTEVHAGHDYMLNNLGFTLDRERDNPAAEQLRTALADRLAADMPVTTLGEEKRFNTFFRLQNPQIIAGLREKFPELPEIPSPREVFVHLRALRNKW